MGIDYTILPEHKVVIIAEAGNVDDYETISFYKKILEDCRLTAEFCYIVDISTTNNQLRSTDAIRRLGDLGKKWQEKKGRPNKVAVIVSSDLSYGLTRMYQIYSDEGEVSHRIFRDAKEAIEWIGIPYSAFEKARLDLNTDITTDQ